MEGAFNGLLSRPEKFGIRNIDYQILVHPKRDPGCRTQAVEFLRPFLSSSNYAMVAFDHHGCGSSLIPTKIQSKVGRLLFVNGWEKRSHVVVIDPELEEWVWAPSPHVSRALGWGNNFSDLRRWLHDRDLWPSGQSKPIDPKQAMEAAMHNAPGANRPRRSSAIFERIANSSDPMSCRDSAFSQLRETLQAWFPLGD